MTKKHQPINETTAGSILPLLIKQRFIDRLNADAKEITEKAIAELNTRLKDHADQVCKEAVMELTADAAMHDMILTQERKLVIETYYNNEPLEQDQ